MADKLRVGIVGVGFGSVVHIPAFQSEGWDVVAAWSRRAERAREAAEQHGIAHVHEDWRELVTRDDIEAVAISTPPPGHHDITMAALDAGKHVLCEKPFARTVAEATAMRDRAAATGLTAMVAHEFRFAPQRQQIKELLDQGVIGRPQLLNAELFMGRAAPTPPSSIGWGARVSEGGGLLGALGSHYIDGFRHWFGDVVGATGTLRALRPDRTDPVTGAIVQADAEDTFTFTLTFASGVVATMTASSAVAPGLGARILISGTDGLLLATQRGGNPDPDGVVLHGRPADRELTPLPVPEHLRPFEDDRDPRLVAFRLLVREFERGIREGTSPSPSFEDGLRCRVVLEEIRESASG